MLTFAPTEASNATVSPPVPPLLLLLLLLLLMLVSTAYVSNNKLNCKHSFRPFELVGVTCPGTWLVIFCVPPFQLATPPRFQASHVPKGELAYTSYVILDLRWNAVWPVEHC